MIQVHLGSLIWCLPWSAQFSLDLPSEPVEPRFGPNSATLEVFNLSL